MEADEMTVAEKRAIEWYAAMRWLDHQGAPGGHSLVDRLMAWRDQGWRRGA